MLSVRQAEKMLYDCLGNWLEGSGWTPILTSRGVVSFRVADSLLKFPILLVHDTCIKSQRFLCVLYYSKLTKSA